MKRKLALGAALIVVLGAAGGYFLTRDQLAETKPAGPLSVAATPAGVTFQPQAAPTALISNAQPARDLMFADPRGMTLYTFDKDTPSQKPACVGDCVKSWTPLIAPATAQPVDNWSFALRDDGAKQWAYRGKPLYTATADTAPGMTKGDKADNGQWHVAVYRPANEVVRPPGIGVLEVPEANGEALVNERRMTLYVFEGNSKGGLPSCAGNFCVSHWTPAIAPQLAQGVGDFSIVAGANGIRQWAYKGRPLFTYDGDLEKGDANGIGVDPQWNVALVARFFMPADVSIEKTYGMGKVLAAKKQSLYHRDTYTYAPGGHGLRGEVPPRPAAGRAIGTKTCDAECLKTWHPFIAPPDAQPAGYWNLIDRGDGTKQWTYQDYALYTYAGDKKPGEITGNDNYDFIRVSDDPTKLTEASPFPQGGAPALLWTFAAPY